MGNSGISVAGKRVSYLKMVYYYFGRSKAKQQFLMAKSHAPTSLYHLCQRFTQENVQMPGHTASDDSSSSGVCSFTPSHIHSSAHRTNIYCQVSVDSSVESRGTDTGKVKTGAKLCPREGGHAGTHQRQCGQSRWKAVFRSTLVEKDAGLASSLGKA